MCYQQDYTSILLPTNGEQATQVEPFSTKIQGQMRVSQMDYPEQNPSISLCSACKQQTVLENVREILNSYKHSPIARCEETG